MNIKPTTKRAINAILHELLYEPDLPILDVKVALYGHNLDVPSWDGAIFCGRDGSLREELYYQADKFSVPVLVKNAMLVFEWHKMESGRYEINSYVS